MQQSAIASHFSMPPLLDAMMSTPLSLSAHQHGHLSHSSSNQRTVDTVSADLVRLSKGNGHAELEWVLAPTPAELVPCSPAMTSQHTSPLDTHSEGAVPRHAPRHAPAPAPNSHALPPPLPTAAFTAALDEKKLRVRVVATITSQRNNSNDDHHHHRHRHHGRVRAATASTDKLSSTSSAGDTTAATTGCAVLVVDRTASLTLKGLATRHARLLELSPAFATKAKLPAYKSPGLFSSPQTVTKRKEDFGHGLVHFLHEAWAWAGPSLFLDLFFDCDAASSSDASTPARVEAAQDADAEQLADAVAACQMACGAYWCHQREQWDGTSREALVDLLAEEVRVEGALQLAEQALFDRVAADVHQAMARLTSEQAESVEPEPTRGDIIGLQVEMFEMEQTLADQAVKRTLAVLEHTEAERRRCTGRSQGLSAVVEQRIAEARAILRSQAKQARTIAVRHHKFVFKTQTGSREAVYKQMVQLLDEVGSGTGPGSAAVDHVLLSAMQHELDELDHCWQTAHHQLVSARRTALELDLQDLQKEAANYQPHNRKARAAAATDIKEVHRKLAQLRVKERRFAVTLAAQTKDVADKTSAQKTREQAHAKMIEHMTRSYHNPPRARSPRTWPRGAQGHRVGSTAHACEESVRVPALWNGTALKPPQRNAQPAAATDPAALQAAAVSAKQRIRAYRKTTAAAPNSTLVDTSPPASHSAGRRFQQPTARGNVLMGRSPEYVPSTFANGLRCLDRIAPGKDWKTIKPPTTLKSRVQKKTPSLTPDRGQSHGQIQAAGSEQVFSNAPCAPLEEGQDTDDVDAYPQPPAFLLDAMLDGTQEGHSRETRDSVQFVPPSPPPLPAMVIEGTVSRRLVSVTDNINGAMSPPPPPPPPPMPPSLLVGCAPIPVAISNVPPPPPMPAHGPAQCIVQSAAAIQAAKAPAPGHPTGAKGTDQNSCPGMASGLLAAIRSGKGLRKAVAPDANGSVANPDQASETSQRPESNSPRNAQQHQQQQQQSGDSLQDALKNRISSLRNSGRFDAAWDAESDSDAD